MFCLKEVTGVKRAIIFMSVGIGVVFLFGLVTPLISPTNNTSLDASYLLTVVSTVATLSGLGFALYGLYTVRELPRIIDKSIQERMEKFETEYESKMHNAQKAVQKVIASYNVSDADMKISLLKDAIAIDPTVYNGYTALGYAYWYDKKDLVSAHECFKKALEYDPGNYEAACDLVALSAQEKEWISALGWMNEAISRNPDCWQYFEADTRLDELRGSVPEKYQQIIKRASNQKSSS